jgi:transposase
MVMSSPFVITLSDSDRAELTARAQAAKIPYRDVLRAKIILACAAGISHAAIAAVLGICDDTVRKWRRRFAGQGLAGLTDLPRPGRAATFTPVQKAEITALACTPPEDSELPLARWSTGELAAAAIAQGLVTSISPATIGRWLAADAIKPWQHRCWIFPRDPDFAAKAGRVLDLYARCWQGEPLGEDDYVISADEKSQLQALQRRHRDLAVGPGRTRRVEFEYRRGGTLAYLAALDVHHARVIGTIADTTGIVPFAELVTQVMTTEPYASARRVFWVVDNGSSHAGQASIDRMKQAWPTAELVHLPIHASWLNQIEIYFSILQRKAIATGDFAHLDHLAARILAFQHRYNTTAKPFDWRYSRNDLNNYLTRLRRHDHQSTPHAA